MAWLPIAAAERRNDGTFRKFAPSGVSLVYLTAKAQPLCAACAQDVFEAEDHDEFAEVLMFGAHESGPAIECDRCGESIESYYGE